MEVISKLSENGVGFVLFWFQIVLPFRGASRLNNMLSTRTRSHVNKVKNLKTTIARLSWFSRLANGFTRTKHDDQLLGESTFDVIGFVLVWTRSISVWYRSSGFVTISGADEVQ